MNLNDSIKIAKEYLHLGNFNFEFKPDNKEYSVTVKKEGNNVLISYSETACLFYGLTILKENEKKENFIINKKRKFKFNGSMYDCSRNAALNIETIKKIILLSSLMGLNRFMLYTEDVYEIPDEPYFGYFRGRYTKEEIKEIVSYGTAFGVDIIPCIQTLSHLNQAFRWSCYNPIKDSSCTMNVEKEEVYPFITKMIKTCRENFTSKYIHIGMDEAADLGLSSFLNQNRLVDKKELLLNHTSKVVSICKENGFIPMMWCDMFFKVDSKAKPDWYDLKGNLDKEIKERIPDVELIYWNYYDNDKDRYLNNMKTSLDTKKEVIFADGLVRWIGLAGNITPSIVKASMGLKCAIKSKIDNVFITTWEDASSISTYSSLSTFLALHSVFDFDNGSLKKVSKLLKTVTNLSLEEWETLELPNRLRDEFLPYENCATPYFYQDVLLGLFDTRVKYEYEEKYHNHYLTLKKMSKKKTEFAYAFKYSALMCDFLSIKVCLGKRIREQYKNKDKEGLRNSVNNIKLAIKKLDAFNDEYFKMWRKENKAFGYEINNGRFGFLKERMNTAIKLIEMYLNGEIDHIEELDQDVLPYDGAKDDEAHCYNVWSYIVSANNPY